MFKPYTHKSNILLFLLYFIPDNNIGLVGGQKIIRVKVCAYNLVLKDCEKCILFYKLL